MRLQAICIGIMFYLLCPTIIIGMWWAAGSSPLMMDPASLCRKSRRIGGKQREICQKEPEIVKEVANGAKIGLLECQYQMRNRRWNCTTRIDSVSKILKHDNREAAFVQALSSAGVTFTVTQACSMGLLLQCSCVHTKNTNKQQQQLQLMALQGGGSGGGPGGGGSGGAGSGKNGTAGPGTIEGQWKWGGCDDNIDFGSNKSVDFMDVTYAGASNRTDPKTLILRHNNEAGRIAIKAHTRIDCKCHGLSGSCNFQTCWKRMPIFRDVGDRLRNAYDSAVHVTVSNKNYDQRLVPRVGTASPGREQLVFSEESPNFCQRRKKVGSLGTKGRLCIPQTMAGTGSCELLCCGRGYVTQSVETYENCNCRFRWCCEVTCQTCRKEHIVHRCR